MKTYFRLIFFFVITTMNSQNITFKTPDFLQKGDTILIVSPAGIIKQQDAIQKAKETFENWGYNVSIGDAVFNEYHHFAGTDDERSKDFQWALDHPTAKVIWCARGGYGSVRIIDQLDFNNFAKHPKWIVGYSDITVFHNQLHNLGFQSIHAPMPINFKENYLAIEESIEQLHYILQGNLPHYKIRSNPSNKSGTCKGVLVGGNLTILENMVGTNSCFSTKNKILFIEEIGEYKYHIDRLLRALDRKGYFEECAGLVVGNFTDTKKNYPEFGQTIEEIILSLVEKYNIPVLFDFPAGHELKNLSLIFGSEIYMEIDKNNSSIQFIK